MLFKVLKQFGLDVRGEIAAVQGQIEQRIDDIADHAKHIALSTAVGCGGGSSSRAWGARRRGRWWRGRSRATACGASAC